MIKLIISLLLLAGSYSYAKDTWFGITGINPNTRSQNYPDFYQESNAFLAACKKNPARDCRRYINPNTNHAAVSGASIVGENKGTPFAKHNTDQGVLKEIKKTLANAKRGDQIVISLSNHGGPGWDKAKKDTSCIFIGGVKQKICDTDLKRIIGNLPDRKGFKVAVIVDGCFSGGFNTLSGKNVCVATNSDQQRAAYGGRFWPSVVEKSPATLADAGATYHNGGNIYDHTMTASEYMEHKGCTATQKYVAAAQIPNLIAHSPDNFSSAQLCAENSGYRQLNQLSLSMNDIVTKVSDAGTVQQICAVSSEWCATIQNIVRNQNAFLQSREYASLMNQISNLQSRMNARIGDLYAGLSANEVRQVSMFVNYGVPLANVSGGAQQEAAAYTAFANENKAEVDSLFARMSGLIKEWQASPIATDLRKLSACLSTPMPVNSKSALILELEAKARTRRVKNFTQQDKLDARQCEQSFRL